MASWQSRLLCLFLKATVKRRLDPAANPAILRARVEKMVTRMGAAPKWVRTTPVSANGVPAEWVDVPESDPSNILLYLHGGGYVLGSPNTHRHMVGRICRAANARALLIDYRLAPENPFPAAVEDAEAAYRWLLATTRGSAAITIAGDSAGGGLTAATLLNLKETGLPMPAGAALLSPWTDLAFSGRSLLTKAKVDPMLRLDGAVLGAQHYLQATVPPTHPLASPLYGEFGGLPPLMIQVGEREILLDDSTRLAERARAAGVSVTLESWPGMPHVFQAFPNIPESAAAIDRLGEFLAGRFAAARHIPAEAAE